jgi:hypothetical protein
MTLMENSDLRVLGLDPSSLFSTEWIPAEATAANDDLERNECAFI